MQTTIPSLKAEWLGDGDTKKFLGKLKEECRGIWTVVFSKSSGVLYKSIAS